MSRTSLGALALLAAAVVVVAGTIVTRAADHRDSPLARNDPSADINDIYAFVPADTSKAVLVMTVEPLTPPGADRGFRDDVLYRFRIDNDGDKLPDHDYRIRFRNGRVRCVGNGVDIQGRTNEILEDVDKTGVKLFAGVRDDPFFFDAARTRSTLDTGMNQFVASGTNTFGASNNSAIVLELPKTLLQGGVATTTLSIWGTTEK